MRFDHLIRGDLVLPDAILRDGWIAITGQSIAAIGSGTPPDAAAIHDHAGHLVLPGLVDGHMHTSSHTGWEGIAAPPAPPPRAASPPSATCPTTRPAL